MGKHRKILAILTLFVVVILLAAWYLHGHTIAVLQPAGPIGEKERNLMIFAVSISAIVVIPVFTILGLFAWRYRESNPRGRYDPKLEGSGKLEAVWWLTPAIIITIIGVVTWRSSYALDPFKPLSANTEHIQVVALDWKWLFIYPEQHVASVNVAYVPVGTPVEFDLTSDTVMTSFWVPQLGGQMYAMPGMVTKLNLEAAKPGSYHGLAANISGDGFADQTFTAVAVEPQFYAKSINAMQVDANKLTEASYSTLAKPGVMPAPGIRYYGTVDPNLYDTILMRYMVPINGGDSVDTVNAGVGL
ncbi:MAG TPA: COX aromatic rich motif-containing protein [Verrucomicrobiae bacterium]|nr:COX aromatic rich motif-containing protein [Verrucomicrobiae bacterium]